MSKLVNVAILGATGAVGAELLQLLEERDFPLNNLKLLASPRSAGKTLTFKGQPITVEAVSPEAFEGIDIVLASAGGSTSKKWAKAIVEAGRTGEIGDGRVFVLPVLESYRIRTGEQET